MQHRKNDIHNQHIATCSHTKFHQATFRQRDGQTDGHINRGQTYSSCRDA